MTLKEIRTELDRRAHPQRAESSLKYFTGRSGYGAGDKFIGLTVPQVREVVRLAADSPTNVVLALLQSSIHEERLLALLIWVQQFAKGDAKTREAIYKGYLANTRWVNNWDLVDTSARDIVGRWLEDKDRSILYELARSEDMWERRIAIVATYHFIRLNDYRDTLAISELLLSDTENLLHKATGWMLREVGKRDLPVLERFLVKHQQHLPRTALRYAIEKLPEKRRQEYLKGVAR